MDNAQKAIMIGVALFLTILIIAVVLLITNTGLNTSKKSGDQIATMSKGLEKQLILQYEKKEITGQDVADAIDNYNKQLSGNIIVGVGNNRGKIQYTSPWKVESNDIKSIHWFIPDNNVIEKLNVFYGTHSWTYSAFWGDNGAQIGPINTLENNKLLKNKINLHDKYMGYLIKNRDDMVTIMGIFFLPL